MPCYYEHPLATLDGTDQDESKAPEDHTISHDLAIAISLTFPHFPCLAIPIVPYRQPQYQ